MAKANFDVDFIDDEINNDSGADKKSISEAKKEHMIVDIIHKLFVISAFHNHRKQLNKVAEKKTATGLKTKKGALS